ncbi:MAG: carbohydrate-binding domain-containing protein [Clostridia bacterium]|nr:carbohydrate-binding domain-containing protein [Clostridia bacterium]
MKRFIAILLCGLMLLAMVACDDPVETNAPDQDSTEAEITTEKEEKNTDKEEKTTEKEEKTTETKAVTTEEPTEEETEPVDEPTVEGTLYFDEKSISEDRAFDLGYRWDKDTFTLTLTGINLVSENGIGIMIYGDATVVIEDFTYNNIVVTGLVEDSEDDYYLGCYGILCTGKLTFQGTGTLNLTVGDFVADVADTGATAYGICAKTGDIAWKEATANIVCGTIGNNSANLRNIQGFRCMNLVVESGYINIDTGDCYTTSKGAFLDGVYAEETYVQNGGEVRINIGYCHVIGDELYRENLGICADIGITVKGGFLEIQAGHGAALGGGGFGAEPPTIDLGDGKITAGHTNKGVDEYYNNQLYLKVVY